VDDEILAVVPWKEVPDLTSSCSRRKHPEARGQACDKIAALRWPGTCQGAVTGLSPKVLNRVAGFR
jgi:hypothetical protein